MLAGKDLTMLDGLTISITGILMVFLELLLLAIAVVIISKVVGVFTSKGKKDKSESTSSESASVPVVSGTPLPETQSAGQIDLVNVSEADAAVIMAIVSHQSGIPLNRLSFKSIKLLEEK